MTRKHGARWRPDPEAEKQHLDHCASALLIRLERFRKENPSERAALDLMERGIPSKA